MRRSCLALGACAALLGALAAVPAPADEKGEAILREAFKTLHAAKSFTANLSATGNQPGLPAMKGTVAALKPNYLRVEVKGPEGKEQIFAADGKNYFIYPAGPNPAQYIKRPNEAAPTEFLGMWEGEIDAFFGGEKNLAKGETSYVGSEKVDGVDCDQVKVVPTAQGPTVVYSIGKSDHLIRRSVITFKQGDQMASQTNVMTNIKLNAAKKPADFAYTPPKDAKPAQPGGAPDTAPRADDRGYTR